jgi:UDP-N-acetylglucosamine 2-epimerase (non-hydrolysing)
MDVMALRKPLLVFGTRPEAIKLFPVAHALANAPGVASRCCVTGQHGAMLDHILSLVGLVPDIRLSVGAPGQSLDQLTTRLIESVGGVLDELAPDRVVVQGDTSTAMATALAAHHRRIPIGHVEAGLRSGDLHQPWPEEGHRRIIAQLADRHWAPTRAAAEALRRNGVDPATIRVTGNTVIDALHWMAERLATKPGLAHDLDPVLARMARRRMILVTMHRRENWDGGLVRVARALLRIVARGDVGVLLPLHANPAIRLVIDPILAGHPAIVTVPALDYPCFVRAMQACTLVLTDSGGVQEEAPALGKPVLVLRDTTERPEGVAAGTARLVGTDPDRIVTEVAHLLDDPAAYAAMARAHSPYGDGRAAARIAADVAA